MAVGLGPADQLSGGRIGAGGLELIQGAIDPAALGIGETRDRDVMHGRDGFNAGIRLRWLFGSHRRGGGRRLQTGKFVLRGASLAKRIFSSLFSSSLILSPPLETVLRPVMGACFSRWVVKALQFRTTVAFLKARWWTSKVQSWI